MQKKRKLEENDEKGEKKDYSQNFIFNEFHRHSDPYKDQCKPFPFSFRHETILLEHTK